MSSRLPAPAPAAPRIRIRWLALSVFLLGLFGSSGNALAEKLRWHLETLAKEHGFRIVGADLIGDEQAPFHKAAKTADRLNQLLTNYNFVITRDDQDHISQLTIVGLRVPPPPVPPASENIKTEKHRTEHYVEAVLTGPNGRFLPLKFMVDTGASTLVLPQSLAAELGYSQDQLQAVRVQTANGKTTGLSGTLQSVRVGAAETASVAVTFVEDHLLGGKQLLGMSFLSRFRMTIDNSNGVLRLEKQDN